MPYNLSYYKLTQMYSQKVRHIAISFLIEVNVFFLLNNTSQHKKRAPGLSSQGQKYGGGHGGRPLPLGYHLRLCFTGVPRMGPSMPLPALSLADRQDRSPGLELVRKAQALIFQGGKAPSTFVPGIVPDVTISVCVQSL